MSRAFQSKADRMYKIGITRPILGEDGTFLGAFVVTVATDPTFGSLNFKGEHRSATLAAQLESGGDAGHANELGLPDDGLVDDGRIDAGPADTGGAGTAAPT